MTGKKRQYCSQPRNMAPSNPEIPSHKNTAKIAEHQQEPSPPGPKAVDIEWTSFFLSFLLKSPAAWALTGQ